jgi:lipoprotein-anchoring transpeptidase ErfK/SrfK
MQRIVIPAVLTIFAVTPAGAGPLDLNPQSQPDTAFAQVFAAPPPEPTRTAQAAMQGPNYGGGFFEMLFAPPSRQQAAPRYYAPAPALMPPEQRLPPAYYRAQPVEPQGLGSALLEQPAQQGRRSVDPKFMRQEVDYNGKEKSGTVIINTRERLLYLVHGDGRATRYGIGVGRPGFTWAGVHHVTNKREWPDWTPPDEMLKRRPDLPRHMEGGPENPLGARAMYLGSTLYRIHGSNEPWTIGQAVSSGCIRMRNEDVIDLYERVKVGTRVMVI